MLSPSPEPITNDEPIDTSPKIEICSLSPADDATAFRTLNEEWITRHFTLEAKDIETLGDPQHMILLKGGHIFMLYADTEPAGCVALIAMSNGVYELPKMAISPSLRGHGLGRRLLMHAVEQARLIGATSLFLGSNTKLANAVHLYDSTEFWHVPPESLPPTPYSRANVFMKMTLWPERRGACDHHRRRASELSEIVDTGCSLYRGNTQQSKSLTRRSSPRARHIDAS